MLGKNKIKTIKSLEHKKYRLTENLFIAEGSKLVSELLQSDIQVETLIGTSDFLTSLKEITLPPMEVIEACEAEIAKASFLKTPPPCIALCRIPVYTLREDTPSENLVLCLDNIQDPGNMGTIIRLADWFGIDDVLCTPGTADLYNPKTIQATMGSICRVRVHYTPPEIILNQCYQNNIPVAGTFLGGENIYTTALPNRGIIVTGNEGKGISETLLPYFSLRLTIPPYGYNRQTAESLNVSTATAIVLSEFRRNRH